MKSVEKFKLNDGLSRFAAVLISCFFLALVFTELPNLPDYPTHPSEWRWFVTSWNLAGPLIFIVIFRIHALRALGDIIRKKRVHLGITPWVKFWFGAAMFFGVTTLVLVGHNYLASGFSTIT